MHFLYTFSLRLYFAALWIASFFNPRAKAWIQGRKDWKKELAGKIRKIREDASQSNAADVASLRNENPDHQACHDIVWFHCA
ncbi:MAG: hypothetical protein NTW31_13380, partial [Bacteroidetes bacterium]|nr:hypothetical protein [Bacteroidota bacterium]